MLTNRANRKNATGVALGQSNGKRCQMLRIYEKFPVDDIKLEGPKLGKLGRLQDGIYLAPFDGAKPTHPISKGRYIEDDLVHARGSDAGECLNDAMCSID
jgi:hypothetical protein